MVVNIEETLNTNCSFTQVYVMFTFSTLVVSHKENAFDTQDFTVSLRLNEYYEYMNIMNNE